MVKNYINRKLGCAGYGAYIENEVSGKYKNIMNWNGNENRYYVVLVFMGLIPQRNTSMKDARFLRPLLPWTVKILHDHYKLSYRWWNL